MAKIKLGKLDVLELGNDAKSDWGLPNDYVEGMYLMLQADKSDTYALATHHSERVRDIVTDLCRLFYVVCRSETLCDIFITAFKAVGIARWWRVGCV